VRSITFEATAWGGHMAGQHVDIRLTADNGYQAQRSYSIASPAGRGPHVELTVERVSSGEVSEFLTEELRAGDAIELRGPIGGYFTWNPSISSPLMLIAGGSGVVPLMSMLRTRYQLGSKLPARLLYSSRSAEDIIYRDELDRLVANRDGFYSYEAKYEAGGSTHIVPAAIDEDLAARLQMLGLSAHRLLGLRDYSRSDFIVTRDNRPYLLEVNSLPGLTPVSLVPDACAAIGIGFEALIERLVGYALARAELRDAVA